MHIYKDGESSITLGKNTYTADQNGIITVPDNEMSSSVWTWGFVSAKGRIAQLEADAAQAKETPVAAEPEAKAVEQKPAAKNSDKTI